jgi:hypothetical protein
MQNKVTAVRDIMHSFKQSVLASTLPSALAFASLSSLGALAARADGTFGDFFDQGKLLIDARYRYEHVDQDGFANEANAHTLRARVGFLTGKVWDLQVLVEGEGIVQFNDDLNDTTNGNVTFPVVADPEDFQINRLQIEYSGLPQTVITAGRQRVNLDNQRFVGGVAFRQNEQTFDAARITNTSIENLNLTYIYVNQINRVFGEEGGPGAFQGALEGDTHLLNAGYDIKDWGKATGYAYWIDLEDAPQATVPSTRTLGLRFAGKHPITEEITALYGAEYATQSDYRNNPRNYDVDYWMLEAGVAAHGFKLLGGVESLEGNGVDRFQTPLATLHKFQGYADVFLVTPANGIVDVYGTVGYETKVAEAEPLTSLMAAVTYHDFEAERGSGDLGSEVDIELLAKFGDHWSAGIKYADYDGFGTGAFADRDKLWLSAEFTY